MVDNDLKERVQQKRFDSLAAKHLHVRRMHRLNRFNRTIDFLALAVPIVYFALRYTAKGTSHEHWVEPVWEVLAGILLAMIVFKLAFHWEERAQKHSGLLAENIGVVRQAEGLLVAPHISPESAALFLVLADRSEKEDRDLLGQPRAKDRQFAYREALKESGGATAVCPLCALSPWRVRRRRLWEFGQELCDVCGNALVKS